MSSPGGDCEKSALHAPPPSLLTLMDVPDGNYHNATCTYC